MSQPSQLQKKDGEKGITESQGTKKGRLWGWIDDQHGPFHEWTDGCGSKGRTTAHSSRRLRFILDGTDGPTLERS